MNNMLRADRLAGAVAPKQALWLGELELRLTLLASLLLICGMVTIGFWAGQRVEDGALQRAASGTVLNMESVIGSLVQELAYRPTLTQTAQNALALALERKALGRNVVAIKIWSPLGTIVYSNQQQLAGRTFPMKPHLLKAFDGVVAAEFDDLRDEENEFERSFGLPLLEVYAPMRERGTNRIIAVAEFYEVHENLQSELASIRLQSWALVVSLTVALVAAMTAIVVRLKRHALEQRVNELATLLAANHELQSKITNAQLRMAEINELFLRRTSAELHDGPAQLIGFALLRLDASRSEPSSAGVELVRTALQDALTEIRTISAGLALPELAELTLAETLEMAATRHAKRTGTQVCCSIDSLPDSIDPSLKICLYRFAQEGLNNAFHHAGGRGQQLHASCRDGLLEVVVADDGLPAGSLMPVPNADCLGLKGLRGRIEAIGGMLEFQVRPGQDARLTAQFNLFREPDHG